MKGYVSDAGVGNRQTIWYRFGRNLHFQSLNERIGKYKIEV